ncbi:acyltransferase [uncultured Cocleimonas sp.]|uniref:acyltransferase family protein n=1 Tax=uncultured Cocleimonas sp. TaxID=1051587 RepID=UPI0026171E43|nr:acyltransferase [uncultured Cocleimonas sp.]
MKWHTLSSNETLIMKGIAILMIAVHNFMHLFPFPKENEFDFSFERTSSMLHLLWTEPENSIRVLFSFFGHFGVEVFIFLSAYGLTKKSSKHTLTYWSFISDRIAKLFPAFIIAILIWLALEGFYSHGILGPFKMLSMHYQEILLKLTLVSNFIPDMALESIGPWWFIPFIFQFYFAFPFLLKLYDRWQTMGLVTLSVFCLVFSATVDGSISGVNLYYTIVPYMPVFALGIYLAKQDISIKAIEIPGSLLLLTVLIFILGNVNPYLWVLSNISFIILFLVTMNTVIPKIQGNLQNILIFTGEISMALFLVNGFLRFPMLRWAVEKDNWLITIALCLVFLAISYIVAIILIRLERLLTPKLKAYRYKYKRAA